jgi:putative FmdB family regulatory protein
MCPAYDFQCKECGRITEINRAMTDSSKVYCTKCQGETRQIYSFSVKSYPVRNVRARMNGKVLWEA